MLLKGEIVPSGRKTVQTYSHGSPTSSWNLMYSKSQQLVGHGIYDYLLSHKVTFLEFHRLFAANYSNEAKDFSEAETGSRMEKWTCSVSFKCSALWTTWVQGRLSFLWRRNSSSFFCKISSISKKWLAPQMLAISTVPAQNQPLINLHLSPGCFSQ